MASGSHDPLVTGKIKPPSERGTGIVFTVVALIVAVIFRRTPEVWISAAAVAGILAVVSFAKPALLRPLNRAWFRLALLLNRIVNPVVMLLIFVVAFLPTGLLMRIWRDPLQKRRRPDLKTYWVVRDPAEPGHSMRNQF